MVCTETDGEGYLNTKERNKEKNNQKNNQKKLREDYQKKEKKFIRWKIIKFVIMLRL